MGGPTQYGLPGGLFSTKAELPRVHSAGNKAHWSPEAEKELQQARGHCPSLQVDNRRGMSAGLGRGIEGQPTTTEQT